MTLEEKYERLAASKRRMIKAILSVNDIHPNPEAQQAIRAIVMTAAECFYRTGKDLIDA